MAALRRTQTMPSGHSLPAEPSASGLAAAMAYHAQRPAGVSVPPRTFEAAPAGAAPARPARVANWWRAASAGPTREAPWPRCGARRRCPAGTACLRSRRLPASPPRWLTTRSGRLAFRCLRAPLSQPPPAPLPPLPLARRVPRAAATRPRAAGRRRGRRARGCLALRALGLARLRRPRRPRRVRAQRTLPPPPPRRRGACTAAAAMRWCGTLRAGGRAQSAPGARSTA